MEGSYGTKIDFILRYLIYLSKSESKPKSLVFSQWDQVLGFLSLFSLGFFDHVSSSSPLIRILAAGLKKNNIRFTRLEGKTRKDAVEEFRKGEVEVFILPGKSHSAGLSLIAATHVFLVEPVLNAAVEWQAVNRVHRIGQSSPTYVHRILIKDSIEPKILSLRDSSSSRSSLSFSDQDTSTSMFLQKPTEQG